MLFVSPDRTFLEYPVTSSNPLLPASVPEEGFRTVAMYGHGQMGRLSYWENREGFEPDSFQVKEFFLISKYLKWLSEGFCNCINMKREFLLQSI